MSLKYAPGDASLGSSHSTDVVFPKPGILISTPFELDDVLVTLSYTSLMLSICKEQDYNLQMTS
jgi:hypothetical protein